MRLPGLLFVAGCFIYLTDAEDVVCTKKMKKVVTINEGDSFSFKTQAGDKYEAGTKCTVKYKKNKSCPAIRFSCSEFDLINKNTKCKIGDKMFVTADGNKEKFCQGSSPDVTTTSKTIKVVFKADKNIQGSGALCTAECSSDETTLPSTSSSPSTTPTSTPVTNPTGTTGAAGTRSYLAGLSYSFDSSNSPFCAGSLISSQWVLTTASCSYSDGTKTGAGKVRAVLGEETLGTTDQENFKVVSVKKIIVHPSYSPSSSTGQNNLALWKLSEAVSTSVYSTVCLPTQGTEQDGAATLVGWRISEVVGSLSPSLTQTDTQLVSDTECGVSDTILCTAGDSTGCQGDYGGPLLQGDNTLIGAVSNNRGCSKNQYGIFTQISKFSTWIQTQVADNGGGTVCVQ